MKKHLLISAIALSLFSCTKDTEETTIASKPWIMGEWTLSEMVDTVYKGTTTTPYKKVYIDHIPSKDTLNFDKPYSGGSTMQGTFGYSISGSSLNYFSAPDFWTITRLSTNKIKLTHRISLKQVNGDSTQVNAVNMTYVRQ